MLLSQYKFNHISSGNILRAHVSKKTELGKQVEEYVNKGTFVPDRYEDSATVKYSCSYLLTKVWPVRIITDVVLSACNKNEPHIFDGFPRTVLQAEILRKSINIDAVLSLDIPHEVIIQRLANRWTHLPSGRTYAYDLNPPKKLGFDDITGEPLYRRDDDHPDVIKKRLQDYQNMTAPVIDYFSNLSAASSSENSKPVIFASFSGTQSKVIYKSIQTFLVEKGLVWSFC